MAKTTDQERAWVERTAAEAPPVTDGQRARLARLLSYRRCDELVRKGTGHGACDTPLDERGDCPRRDEHLEGGRA